MTPRQDELSADPPVPSHPALYGQQTPVELEHRLTKLETTIKNFRWFAVLLVMLFSGVGVALGALTRVFAILT